MRLVTFDKGGRAVPGVRRGDDIVDLSVAAPELPGSWPEICAAGAMDRIAAAVAVAPGAAVKPAASVRLLAPIPNPPKILAIGLNYRSHAEEAGIPIPDYPIVFPRWPGSIVGHGEAILRPPESTQFDYEAELLVVIGTGGRRIPKARALDHVLGYSAFNDGSLRDYQFKANQWTMGKNFDASGAFGPEIVTPDELPSGAAGLRIQCRLNGEVLQDGNTDDMIFDVATLIAELSVVMTLEPGDIIPTGTPPGVGFARKPPVWMKPGDVCEVEIEGIGTLRNPVADEADA